MFAALVAATVGAFFLTQHLKVSPPLITGSPVPVPSAFNPVSGRVCVTDSGKRVDFSKTWISFVLLNTDTVEAYIFNSDGDLVKTVSTGTRVRRKVRSPRFYWNGRESDGRIAPDGTYYWRFVLERENRTDELTDDPIKLITTTPHPVVRSVRVAGTSTASTSGPAIITPPKQSVTIHFTKADYRQAVIMLWRTDLGRPRLAKEYVDSDSPASGTASWDGTIDGRSATAGTYMVGVRVTDRACNQATFPIAQPPVTSEPGTGVTVRYLAAQPPLGPVPAGSTATVYVDSRLQPYRWSLWAPGARKAIARGNEPGDAYELHVRLPAGAAGLYELTVRSGPHFTSVPLVADATIGAPARARVLVVLPMLSWQGENPVDDSGGGIPDTLSAGGQIQLRRPLLDGLPRGFGDEASLLRYLKAAHLSFQLTTDVALAQGAGAGPGLAGHSGVILDGPFTWLPEVLGPQLRGYVQSGGRTLSIGAPSLQAQAPIRQLGGGSVAGPSSPLSPDPFGVHRGAISTTAGELIARQSDPLGILPPVMALTGFRSFQTLTPPGGVAASVGGVAAEAPTIVGFRSGEGRVVEIGLPGFASSLRGNVGSQQLLARIWQLLSS